MSTCSRKCHSWSPPLPGPQVPSAPSPLAFLLCCLKPCPAAGPQRAPGHSVQFVMSPRPDGTLARGVLGLLSHGTTTWPAPDGVVSHDHCPTAAGTCLVALRWPLHCTSTFPPPLLAVPYSRRAQRAGHPQRALSCTLWHLAPASWAAPVHTDLVLPSPVCAWPYSLCPSSSRALAPAPPLPSKQTRGGATTPSLPPSQEGGVQSEPQLCSGVQQQALLEGRRAPPGQPMARHSAHPLDTGAGVGASPRGGTLRLAGTSDQRKAGERACGPALPVQQPSLRHDVCAPERHCTLAQETATQMGTSRQRRGRRGGSPWSGSGLRSDADGGRAPRLLQAL